MTMAMQSIASDAVVEAFAHLDVKSIALLLDVDGTLIDIGPTPHEVHVSEDLCRSLRRLLALTGGALALVSGRPIADLDRLFAPLKLPAIGGHGAEMRVQGTKIVNAAEPLPQGLRRYLAEAAAAGSGIVAEDKGYSFALHYRQAPQLEDRLRAHVAAGRAAYPGEATEVLRGKAMFEVKRPNISKGEGVRELMRQPPFAGRTPVFLGDDVTDETVFAMLPGLGGKGFSVGRHFAGLSGIFHSPAEVRRALQRLAAGGEAGRS
jgi:trehalose 6-phosphate phosphatase